MSVAALAVAVWTQPCALRTWIRPGSDNIIKNVKVARQVVRPTGQNGGRRARSLDPRRHSGRRHRRCTNAGRYRRGRRTDRGGGPGRQRRHHHHRGGRASGGAGLRRSPLPLRRPALLGSHPQPLAAARGDHRREWKLRSHPGTRRSARPRLPESAPGPGRGHPGRGALGRGHLRMGVVRPTARRHRGQAVGPQPRTHGRPLRHPSRHHGPGRFDRSGR